MVFSAATDMFLGFSSISPITLFAFENYFHVLLSVKTDTLEL